MTKKRSPQSRATLVARVANLIEEVTRTGSSVIAKDADTVELTMPQLRTLFHLMQEETPSMSSVSATLGISPKSTTGLMDRLIEKNLVERWNDPNDRRSVRCKLTEEGQDLCERLLAARRSRWEDRLNPLSKEELKNVFNAMEIVLEGARNAAASVGTNDVSLKIKTESDDPQKIGIQAH